MLLCQCEFPFQNLLPTFGLIDGHIVLSFHLGNLLGGLQALAQEMDELGVDQVYLLSEMLEFERGRFAIFSEGKFLQNSKEILGGELLVGIGKRRIRRGVYFNHESIKMQIHSCLHKLVQEFPFPSYVAWVA